MAKAVGICKLLL